MHLFFNSSHSCTTILPYIKGGYKTRRHGEGKKVRDECHIIRSNYTQSLTCICLTYECPCSYKQVAQRGSAEFPHSFTPFLSPHSQVERFQSSGTVSRFTLQFLNTNVGSSNKQEKKAETLGEKAKLQSDSCSYCLVLFLVVLFNKKKLKQCSHHWQLPASHVCVSPRDSLYSHGNYITCGLEVTCLPDKQVWRGSRYNSCSNWGKHAFKSLHILSWNLKCTYVFCRNNDFG